MKDIKEMFQGFRKVYIQPHNNPDADAIASAWGMKKLIESFGKKVEIIYSGTGEFKPNLHNLIHKYQIKMSIITDGFSIPDDELLFIVDAQRGAANLLAIDAANMMIIDHHLQENKQNCIYHNIQPRIGACSSMVYRYLSDYGVEIDSELATALYFGIMLDTDLFTGKMSTIDYDARKDLESIYDKNTIDYLRLSSLSFEQIKILANGLLETERYENILFSRIEECDDNLLGHISDLLSEIDGVDIVVTYSPRPNGYKLSVRSYHDFLTAEELVRDLTENGLGSGGGHKNKAGGYILRENFRNLKPDISPGLYIRTKIINTALNLRLLVVGEDDPYKIYQTKLFKARKRKIYLRYLNLNDIFREKVTIKTLEGVVTAEPSDKVIIGIKSEIWPVSPEIFGQKYQPVIDDIEHCVSDDYIDDFGITIQSEEEIFQITQENIGQCRVCVTTDKAEVTAVQLEEKVKVRSSWGDFSGNKGDYLLINSQNDYYICNQEIFEKTYKY